MTITLHKTHFVPQSCAWYADLQNLFLPNKEIYRVISKHASNCTRKTTFYYLMVQVTVKSSRFWVCFFYIFKNERSLNNGSPGNLSVWSYVIEDYCGIKTALSSWRGSTMGTEWTPLYCPSITDRWGSTTHLSVVYYTVVMRQDQWVRLPSKTI